jgi:exosortase/archaeosortase family protein
LTKPRLHTILKNKPNLFYILAFVPLVPLEYYRYVYFNDILGLLIPLYGFIILVMKKDQLTQYTARISAAQRVLGATVTAVSFFTYYVIAAIYPNAGFYGITNYTVYLFGLLLTFFRFSALKQVFSVFFLIVASGMTGLLLPQIETQITPVVPYYVSVFSAVLRLLAIPYSQLTPTAIILNRPADPLLLRFVSGCIGIYSVIIFSIIVIVIMVETPTNRRTKLLWSAIGFGGVFILNIIRLIIVVVSMYYYGWDIGQSVHQVIGYILFLSWLGIFLLIFAQRQTIASRIQAATARIRKTLLRTW